MRRYLLTSSLAHFAVLALVLFSPWMRRSSPILLVDGFDYMGGGGGTGGGGGPKASQMGQVVPQPLKVPVPSKPAPVQKAQSAEETWKVKDKAPITPPVQRQQEEPVETGEKTQKEQTNIVSRGVSKDTKAGDGFEFGDGTGGTGGGTGKGIGIGVGDGEGMGGFGFGSYLRIMRQRIWSEWTENAVLGSKHICVIALTVARDGGVSDIKLEKPSGDPFYDDVALRAVRNSSPLPPLPSGFPKPEQRFRLQFRLVE